MNELSTIPNKQIQAAEEPLSPAELTEQVKLIQTVMKNVMIQDTHYGKIPGCGPKPALFKAGAEKLQLTFRLHPDFEIQETDLPQGHKNFRVVCRLTNQSGGFQGAGVGYGSTKETKYAYKNGKETSPPDYYNTVLKMSKKRAQVDAILTSTAASDIFTQDLEDFVQGEARQGPERRGTDRKGVSGQAGDETLPRDNWVKNKFPAREAEVENLPAARAPGTKSIETQAPEPPLEWKGVIQDVAKHQGENARGPWTLFRINMEDGNTATTFDEALAKDAEIMIGQEVRVLYEVNRRKAGTFTYKGFEPIESAAPPDEELPWK